MSATEDETQSLDAGWDDAAPSEPDASEPGAAGIDEAWDSLPAPSGTLSSPPTTAETADVDSGWDDVPEPAPGGFGGKRRPHRQRRARAAVADLALAPTPLVLPRPAEPTKKHQRELARKQRAHAALVREERKQEQKAQRAAEAREEAAARRQRAQAEEQARRERQETRERERKARQNATPRVAKAKPGSSPARAAASAPAPRETARQPKAPATAFGTPSKLKVRPATLAVVAIVLAVALLFILRK